MNIGELFLHATSASARDAAYAFADAGIPVFPCLPDGKRPLTPAGFHDATTELTIVRSWWATWPRANLGMPTGAASGFDVIDVDTGDMGTGFTALESARKAGLLDGEAARVRTPSGGLHIYYPTDPDGDQRCWQSAFAHIDFRGEGGYIIVPPSTVRGIAYRLSVLRAGAQHPVDATALRELIDPRPPQTPNPRDAIHHADPDRLARWVLHLQEGERNHGLFWASCRLVEAGYSPTAIETTLGSAAASVGLSAREIASTIRSASRQGAPQTATTSPTWNEPRASTRRESDAPWLA
ncbi:DNA primase [Agromyces sp. CFH 90414]|uniref:DNA primase n=1 Tax=Agromyces agglutinans TaxID=2662258 RepID=A0A6I2F3J5_9MICO|nr:bifunctional DNA primase/polymerase [Agromyces agglutinans]MRG58791.1 DNA primase [Agromyces agglutinans]